MKKIKILLIILLGFLFVIPNLKIVNAEVNKYTDVLDDLREDETFKVEDYSKLTLGDYYDLNNDNDSSNDILSISVINIAESVSNELYIYTYQPLNNDVNLVATSLLMSTNFSSNGVFEEKELQIFDLECVSQYGVFNKYVVQDYTVSNEIERYYNLVTIYRDYNNELDEVVSGGETDGTEIGISVGQQWCCYFLNDKLIYEMNTFNTLELNIEFTGNIEFNNGISLSFVPTVSSGHAWFIAFTCEDYIIKHIYDADLSYKIREIDENSLHGTTIGEWSDEIPLTLTDTQRVSYEGSGLLSKKFNWQRISKGTDFIKNFEKQNVSLSEDIYNNVNNSNVWVFSFVETESWAIAHSGGYQSEYFDIEDVTIMRIKFIDIHNNIYNLGVVTDRVNPDNISDGYGGLDLALDGLRELFEKMVMFISVCILIISVCVLITPLKSLFKLLGQAFLFMLQLLLLPFKLIGSLFKKKRY